MCLRFCLMDSCSSRDSSVKDLEIAQELIENEENGNDSTDAAIRAKNDLLWSISNPDLPFARLMSAQTNFSVLYEGQVLQPSTGFTINFSCYSSCKNVPNIILHLNPRCGQNYVARNTRIDGSWGEEESVSGRRFPFQPGGTFFLEVFFADKEFLIAVNGFHFCSYRYREPISRIKWMEIFGGVKMSRIETVRSKSYPYIAPANYLLKIFKLTPVSTVDLNLNDQKNLEPPIMAELTESFRPGYTLRISGKVKLLPHGFSINFQNGKSYWPRPLINLHINARFNYSEKMEHAVVLNSWLHETWGQEQIPGFCPFSPGEKFILNIFCAKDAFEIIVNNDLLAVYKYRAVLGLIDTIYISGDIMIDEIRSSLEIPQPNIPTIS
nr:PREDICTED: galectin-8-like [Bemisia tabaci]